MVFHGGLDTLALVDPTGEDYPIRLLGRTREALERLTAELGGEWDITEPDPPQAAADDQDDAGSAGDAGNAGNAARHMILFAKLGGPWRISPPPVRSE